jgi:multidrug transporter EmrE-like cation transporter
MLLENINPLLSLVFGFLVLTNPKLLSTLVGLYLLITGLIGLGVINWG